MKLFAIVKLLLPLASGIAKATRKDSPGGKKITKEELLELLLGELDGLHEKLNAE